MGTTPQPFQSQSRNPEVDFLLKGVQPPSNVYAQKDDFLSVQLIIPTLTLPLTVTFNIRMLRPDGQIIPTSFDLVATTTTASTRRNLGEGFLLSLTATLLNGPNPQPGQCYVVAFLSRGIVNAALIFATLISDYLTIQYAPSWPHGRKMEPQEGPGAIRSITGTDPAAGVEISETVPAGTRWELLAIHLTFTTSAVVANRRIQILFDDGANTHFRLGSPQDQTATNQLIYSVTNIGGTPGAVSTTVFIPAPFPILMAPGFRFRTITGALDAGDNYAAPQYLVREWVNV